MRLGVHCAAVLEHCGGAIVVADGHHSHLVALKARHRQQFVPVFQHCDSSSPQAAYHLPRFGRVDFSLYTVEVDLLRFG